MDKNYPVSGNTRNYLDNWFSNMNNELNRLFNDFSSGLSKSGLLKGFREIRIEVLDKDKEIIVIAELPGVEKKDLDTRVYPQQLTIKANKTKSESFSEENNYHSELYYGEISRTIPLPVEVETTNCTAEFKNGVLKISMPKVKPRDNGAKIDIN